jgi:tetratricopeptide (TPR) repeat protein
MCRFPIILAVAMAVRAADVPTFHGDVQPLLYAHCATCHRPGQSAPFPLLSYEDAVKHAPEIVDQTARRIMPPWLPEAQEHGFAGERRLSAAQIAVFADWVKGGKQRGDPAKAVPRPQWSEDWTLGKPDLVIRMPAPYTVPATGKDVYRHFVLPARVDRGRYVRAWEFRPGSRAAHHAFLRLDRSGEGRRRDALDPEPGFPGMDTPELIRSPDGHFASWQPGAGVRVSPAGLPWKLEPGMDVVLQLHLQTLGKPESLQVEVGLYFTDSPPTNQPVKVALVNYDIDLPPGVTNAVYREEYVLPADADALGILPHTHYLGRRIEARAVLPAGENLSLLNIPAWDFKWQGDYTFREPVFLPAGTRIQMQVSFDNSAANPWNPASPPTHVRFGPNTTDEMAEIWIQLLPRTPQGKAGFDKANLDRTLRYSIRFNEQRLRMDPKDGLALLNIGRSLLAQRKNDEARARFLQAAEVMPELDDAHYYLGLLSRMQGRNDEASAAFRKAIGLNPGHARAHGNLGLIETSAGRLDSAASHFDAAIRLNPTDALAQKMLGMIRAQQGRNAEAEPLLQRAVELDPTDAEAANALRFVRSRKQPSP